MSANTLDVCACVCEMAGSCENAGNCPEFSQVITTCASITTLSGAHAAVTDKKCFSQG